RYREGCCILSRYKLLSTGSEYVSSERSIYSIHARKVVFARIHVPYIGFVNIFSVHLSWWSGGFREQFERLREWADMLGSPDLAATLLCGDFNSAPPSDGYSTVVSSGQYEDQFLAAASPDVFEKVFRRTPPDWSLLREDGRIDYIFMKGHDRLKPVSARCLFTESDYGRVSDHPGYMVEFEPF
ncbi:MAG: endonuclease/exonuclease/phosphatase family protein, partial [Desulfobacteraceae bacterium]|nr:endonuclease/exonuclease/phosphatase family protein [Desulfobacteraceae bacterium]